MFHAHLDVGELSIENLIFWPAQSLRQTAGSNPSIMVALAHTAMEQPTEPYLVYDVILLFVVKCNAVI